MSWLLLKHKRPKGLDALFGHLPDRNKFALCYNNHVAATYVTKVTHIYVTSA